MSNVQAIQCKKCGAPAYADQAREGFFCAFCKGFMPWATTRAHFTPEIGFRHRPVPIVDGLLKLTHVGLPEAAPNDLLPEDELSQRLRNTEDKLAALDGKAFSAWTAREMIVVTCKQCGAAMTGSSTQNVFSCAYCQNTIMDAEAFADGVYRQEVLGYDANMYSKAVPFAVSREAAKAQLLRLVADSPRDFRKQDIEKRIDADLQAHYLPYGLEDVSLKATVETERGRLTFYHDRINWALPNSALFDIHLMNHLHPWDFGQTTPFAPAYLDGDVRIFSPQNNKDVDRAMRRMLWRDAPRMVAAAFGLKKVKLLTWDYNFRRHKYAFFNLPVWFLDKRPEDGERDLQVRMAVNGQTGKAAALFLHAGKQDDIRTRAASPAPGMSDECTLFSPPAPIAYVRSPFLFRTMSFDEAVKL